jgi:hypothetical protein
MKTLEWPSLEELSAWAPMPNGYGYKLPCREDVPQLIEAITHWYPDIAIGAASCYRRAKFYEERVLLQGEDPQKDIFVLMYMKGNQLVGMGSMEREPDTLSVYGRLAVVDPNHQGTKLAATGMAVMDGMGVHRGAVFLYVLATMKHPYAQMLLERRGYRLLGFIPGYDREVRGDGKVLRVFEALYAKVLIGDGQLLHPNPEDQTPITRELFNHMFPSATDKPAT